MSGDAPSTQPSSEDESIFEEKENTVSVVFSAVSSSRLSLFCAGGSRYSPPGSICLTEDWVQSIRLTASTIRPDSETRIRLLCFAIISA